MEEKKKREKKERQYFVWAYAYETNDPRRVSPVNFHVIVTKILKHRFKKL